MLVSSYVEKVLQLKCAYLCKYHDDTIRTAHSARNTYNESDTPRICSYMWWCFPFYIVVRYSCNVARLLFFSIVADRTCAVSRINSAARPEDQSRLNQADVEHGLRGRIHRGLFQRNGQCTLRVPYLIYVRSPYKFMQYVRRFAVKFNFGLPARERREKARTLSTCVWTINYGSRVT